MAGEETAAKFQTPIFLVASASAEVIADVALCPWEAVKVCSSCYHRFTYLTRRANYTVVTLCNSHWSLGMLCDLLLCSAVVRTLD